MDEKQQLNLLSIVTLQNEDKTEVDYTIDAIYFGGLTINEVVGTVDDTAEDLTLHGLDKRVDEVIGTENDTADDLTLYGLDKYVDEVVGTENDTEEDLTLYGLKARIESFVPLTDTDIADILG